MQVPVLIWHPPAALPEMVLVPDLAVGAWLAVAFLCSGAALLWAVVRSWVESKRPARWKRRRLRPIRSRRHVVPQRP
jgi:hypothetical protein